MRTHIFAALHALMLSCACVAFGAVYEEALLLLLPLSVVILFGSRSHTEQPNQTFIRIGMGITITLGVILCLQYVLGTRTISDGLPHTLGLPMLDTGNWFPAIGKWLFLILNFFIALHIAITAPIRRTFLNTLLISGIALMVYTFLRHVGSQTSGPYTHGFVNANNAATYLGAMLLLSIACAARFAEKRKLLKGRSFPEFVDRMDLPLMLQLSFYGFAICLSLGGLMLTGSRGGIAISLLASMAFIVLYLAKTYQHRGRQKFIRPALYSLGLVALIATWGIAQFSSTLQRTLEDEGVAAVSRPALYASTLTMIADAPLLGHGLGSYTYTYQAYRPDNMSPEGLYDKAHNTYLEIAAELGIPVLLLMLAAISFLANRLHMRFKESERNTTVPILGISLFMIAALHSLIDFPMQIPGIAAMIISVVIISAIQPAPTRRPKRR